LIIGDVKIHPVYAYGSLAMIFVIPLWLKLDPFEKIDRTREYYCGEQAHYSIAQWCFCFKEQTKTKIALAGALAYVAIALGGLL
jgi:hypothetical protein